MSGEASEGHLLLNRRDFLQLGAAGAVFAPNLLGMHPESLGGKSQDESKQVAISALLPTKMKREDGDWVPISKTTRGGGGPAWEVPVGDAEKVDDGVYEVKIPGIYTVATNIEGAGSLSPSEIPINPDPSMREESESSSSYILFRDPSDRGDGFGAGRHRFDLHTQIPQGTAAAVENFGRLRLEFSVSSGSPFLVEANDHPEFSSVDNSIEIATPHPYGAIYSHQQALGDALETAYHRLELMQSILSLSFGTFASFAVGGARATVKTYLKRAAMRGAYELGKFTIKTLHSKSSGTIENPGRGDLEESDLKEAGYVAGTIFIATDDEGNPIGGSPNGVDIGLSGPMIVFKDTCKFDERDEDNDCSISTAELRLAIRDWAAEEITTNELRNIIRFWTRG